MATDYIYDNFTDTNTPTTNNPSGSGPPSSRYAASYDSSIGTVRISDTEGLVIEVLAGETFDGGFLSYTYDSTFPLTSGDIYLDISGNTNFTVTSSEIALEQDGIYTGIYGITSADGDEITFSITTSFTAISKVSFLLNLSPNTSSTTENFYVRSLSSSVITCLFPGTMILTKEGYKAIETLQRGDETVEGKIARIVVENLSDFTRALLAKIGDVTACENHIFIYKGKRTLAKDLPNAQRIRGMVLDVIPGKKLYDIQYDFEGSYTVLLNKEMGETIQSQSRSPYCKVSPLAKELYFNPKNYKEFLVDNTLREDPPFIN